MTCYYHYGEVLLLEVSMDTPLTKEQKDALQVLFEKNQVVSPVYWHDTKEYNVDADYSEVLGGYVLEDYTTKSLLSDLFAPNQAIEPQGIERIESHLITNEIQKIAPHASLNRCNVAYVSISL